MQVSTERGVVQAESREGAQGTSTIARLCLDHTTLSAHLHRLRQSYDPFCPWCRTTPESMELRPQASTFPSTCCPSPYLYLLKEDWPATMPVMPTHEYPRTHKDP
ncbi:hypothetical protein E2C01_092960 [Portunus trituberculatus]|uniref:Uncharacterized protein n=1 Tax=Portunus trituberculatus TaxID=210409 RepID=A0A5B7JST5_PORTR|nr:hypothetical protein [Portunus trituberculatus]